MRAFASPPVRDQTPVESAFTRKPTRRDHASHPGSSHRFSDIAVASGGGAAPASVPAAAMEPAPTAALAVLEAGTTPATPEAPAAPGEAAAPGNVPAAPATTPALSWAFVRTHTWDDLWFFCGEHPSGFSTRILLRADGYADRTVLRWSIERGADKIEFSGAPTGPEVHVASKAGSASLNDVTVRVTEGTGAGAPSHVGTLTVRKPHRLLPRFVRHHPNCPPFDARCRAGTAAHWTEFGYQIVDNIGGTIVGATMNENFPSTKANDRPNSWWPPVAAPSTSDWRNTGGTFIDYWWVFGDPPLPLNPGDPHDNDSVDRTAHEFYVGSPIPGKGCRVQTHTAHRYLGHTMHENIVSPAP